MLSWITSREQEEDRLFDAMIEAKGLFRCGLSIYVLLIYINQYKLNLRSQKILELKSVHLLFKTSHALFHLSFTQN